jgi:hypothetical protein
MRLNFCRQGNQLRAQLVLCLLLGRELSKALTDYLGALLWTNLSSRSMHTSSQANTEQLGWDILLPDDVM